MTGRLRKSVTIGACLVFIVMDRRADFYNIVYGNLKTENSQDYAQKPQRNSDIVRSFLLPLLFLYYCFEQLDFSQIRSLPWFKKLI